MGLSEDRRDMLAIVEFITVLSCTLFSGAAIYINFVSIPLEWAEHGDRSNGLGSGYKRTTLCRPRWPS
jgi:hypothetical protein